MLYSKNAKLAALLVALAAVATACGGTSSGSTQQIVTLRPTRTPLPTVARGTLLAAKTQAPATLPPGARDFQGGFDSVAFVDDQTGWVGGYLKASERGVILSTTDGGRTWHEQYSAARPIADLQFISPLIGWAVVGPYLSLDAATLLRTTDGGKTWLPIADMNRPISLDFITPTLGRALFEPQYAATLMETTDGGETWAPITTDAKIRRALCFTDGQNGWASDGDNVVKTADGGRSWSVSLSQPEFVNGPGQVWCDGLDVAWSSLVGPADPGHRHALFRTIDGGAIWTRVSIAARNGESIQIVDADTVVVLGHADNDEFVAVTNDGGSTWGPQLSIRGLSRGHAAFVDADHGWAAGQLGGQSVILATTDGGQTWTQQYP